MTIRILEAIAKYMYNAIQYTVVKEFHNHMKTPTAAAPRKNFFFTVYLTLTLHFNIIPSICSSGLAGVPTTYTFEVILSGFHTFHLHDGAPLSDHI